MKFAHRQIVKEANVILGMKILRIYHFVPTAIPQKPIYRFQHFRSLLPIAAFSKCQRAIDEIVLYINN